MKKIIITLVVGVSILTSCSKEWTASDQQTFMDNCLKYAQEENTEICSCGLQKAMEKYNSFEEAQEAMDNMTDEEVVEFLAGCL